MTKKNLIKLESLLTAFNTLLKRAIHERGLNEMSRIDTLKAQAKTLEVRYWVNYYATKAK
jgi:hypothetical protein